MSHSGIFQEERSAIKHNPSANPKISLCYRISGLTAMLVAIFVASSHRQLCKPPEADPPHPSAADQGRGRPELCPRSEPAQTFAPALPGPRQEQSAEPRGSDGCDGHLLWSGQGTGRTPRADATGQNETKRTVWRDFCSCNPIPSLNCLPSTLPAPLLQSGCCQRTLG